MDEQSDRLRRALIGGITGDALGSALDGMSKGHIHAVFGNIRGFIDPFPALKAREHHWKKPGLYTASSQLSILLCLSMPKAPKKRTFPSDTVYRAIQEGTGPHGIFRNPDPLLAGMLLNRGETGNGDSQSHSSPPGYLPPLHLFLPLVMDRRIDGKVLAMAAVKHALNITGDEYAIAASAILTQILHTVQGSPPGRENPWEAIMEPARVAAGSISENSAQLFDMKLNPDRVAARAGEIVAAIEQLPACPDMAEAERIILANAARHVRGNMTRATVHHPLVLAPYIIAFFAFHAGNPREGFFAAASEGGAAGTLTASAGTLWGALRGEDAIPPELRAGLINKSRIERYGEAIAGGKQGGQLLDEFITSEALLTAKANEELNARLKHVKVKEKKVKPQFEREKELGRHIVESWTKLDRAKWRKKNKDRQEP